MIRTWQYGERLFAQVVEVFPRPGQPRCPGYVELRDEHGEGHLLIGGIVHEIEPRRGMEVEMRFTEGGITGGYWKIVDECGPWHWTADEEAEYWRLAGTTRMSAILAASETPIAEAPAGVWIAPGRRATAEDLAEWSGAETPELGEWIVDEERIEHLTLNQIILETVRR